MYKLNGKMSVFSTSTSRLEGLLYLLLEAHILHRYSRDTFVPEEIYYFSLHSGKLMRIYIHTRTNKGVLCTRRSRKNTNGCRVYQLEGLLNEPSPALHCIIKGLTVSLRTRTMHNLHSVLTTHTLTHTNTNIHHTSFRLA